MALIGFNDFDHYLSPFIGENLEKIPLHINNLLNFYSLSIQIVSALFFISFVYPILLFALSHITACVTRKWAGVDSAGEQKKT
jgi:hypothetical protein